MIPAVGYGTLTLSVYCLCSHVQHHATIDYQSNSPKAPYFLRSLSRSPGLDKKDSDRYETAYGLPLVFKVILLKTE